MIGRIEHWIGRSAPIIANGGFSIFCAGRGHSNCREARIDSLSVADSVVFRLCTLRNSIIIIIIMPTHSVICCGVIVGLWEEQYVVLLIHVV